MPNVALGAISVKYSGLGGAYVFISFLPEVSLGVNASFIPGFTFIQHTTALTSQFIAIDVLAVVFIGALITVSDVKSTTDKGTS